MKLLFATALLAASFGTASAQTPSAAPAGSTGECKDGTYSTAASKRGACAGHKGVKDWYAADAAGPAAPPSAKPGAPVPASSPAPATARPTVTTTAAAGGGSGQVWVNTKSKVYHCQGDRYYGKTKTGEYMTEAAAKQAGDRPDRGKACSS